jgi:glycerol-3-phosphate dehydrogenase
VDRNLAIQAISDRSKVWDCLVIGGGATDLGTAVEDASRGLRTLLVEKKDFAKKDLEPRHKTRTRRDSIP